MHDSTACAFPDKRAATGYGYGCRCDRCRAGWRMAAQIRRHGGQPVRFCLTCDKQLPTSRPKYCSEECRGYQRVERRVFTCGAPACHNLCASSQRDAMYCSNPCKLIGKKIRVRGPHAVRTHPHWVMSQPRCGPTLDHIPDTPALRPTLADWPMFGPMLEDWPEFKPTSAPVTHQCQSCERLFTGRARRFCSELCRRIDGGWIATSCDIATGHCQRCAKPYVRPASRDVSGCCSPECTKRLRRSIRRRKVRARRQSVKHEPYTLREIAERDGWRCHLCGGKVPDRDYTADDKDATIDHLIPQSHGGDDVRSNVALAHNRCNWERGNQGLAQLRLTG